MDAVEADEAYAAYEAELLAVFRAEMEAEEQAKASP